MTKSPEADRRLMRVTEVCLALPEATRTDTGDHASFAVRDIRFTYYLNNHHGDGIVAVCFRTAPGENGVLLASDASRFCSPAYIGPKGWVGLCLDVGKVDWTEVADFLTDSYRLAAPKRLAARVIAPPS
jgi:predicted DNA-binding protein (MmcQ/YjbR family)